MNARFYIIVGIVGGVGGFVFARISDLYLKGEWMTSRSLKNLQALVIGLSNSYGLCFVVLLLGPGIVELPVRYNCIMRLILVYGKAVI